MLTHKFRTILGDIPVDWEFESLGNVLELSESGSGSWGDDRGEISLKVLRSTNFTNDGHLDLSDVAIRWFTIDVAERLQPKKGDILLERSGGGQNNPSEESFWLTVICLAMDSVTSSIA